MTPKPLTPQQEIECAYITGQRLTVVTARERYHTTELRRVNSRLQKRFALLGQHIHGEHIVREGKCDPYKTYYLVNDLQERMAI